MPGRIPEELQQRVRRYAALLAGRTQEGRAAVQAYVLRAYADVRVQLRGRTSRPVTVALLLAAACCFAFLLYWTVLVVTVPTVSKLEDAQPTEATIAYTADGEELTRYHIENRTWVGLDRIAPSAAEALIATEDHRFYNHGGIDVARVFGAIIGTAAGERQGGSTITMQLARNIFPELQDDFILTRKFREWLTATRLESRFSKDEILEMYLNSVPFMYDAVGIEAAARTYFEKPASALTVPESATLIGMLKATVYYNPVRNPERSHERRNVVLRQMVRHGYLAEAAYDTLHATPTPLRFRRLTRQDNGAPFFAEYVRQWLDAWAEQHGHNLYTDGLRVYTTLDSRLQAAAEEAVQTVGDEMQAVVDVEWSAPNAFFSSRAGDYAAARERKDVQPFAYFWETHQPFLNDLLRSTPRYRALAQEVPADSALALVRRDSAFVDSLQQVHQRVDASLVAVDPTNGHVKAWVGGRDFARDEYDHVALARRQPGSTFKPFVYVAALQNGYAPYNYLPDRVQVYVDPYTKTRWSPQNFGGATGRYMTLREGLALSKNTITAQLITRVGPQEVVRYAHLMGIDSELQAVPSLGLGTSEVTLLEMAEAYATLTNLGVHHEPVFVTRIEDRHGQVLATFGDAGREAIPGYTAAAVLEMMRGVVDFGTGVRIRSLFGAQGALAGKTGTTQNGADGWFMLAHPNLVVGSWVGFNTPSVSFRTQYWGQGAHNALHVVGDFYQRAHRRVPGALDPTARFREAPPHRWGAGVVPETDDLNRRERANTRLDEKLRRIREQKEALKNRNGA